MITVGQFVAWESPISGVTYKGRVQERREIDGMIILRIKVAGTYEIGGDAIVSETDCRVIANKKEAQ